jgi:putative restriction endonuclease
VAHGRGQRPDLRYPFHHLKTNGFWSALDEDAKPSTHRNLTRLAVMPSDFLAVLKNPPWRDKARHVLIAKYFQPSERIALYELAGIPISPEEEIQRDAAYKSPEEAQNDVREVRLRLRLVAACDYTCALTGYRLTTISGTGIVDAAHIHQFSDSRNNELRNGLALCKNAHWLFDKGLWTISQEYKGHRRDRPVCGGQS